MIAFKSALKTVCKSLVITGILFFSSQLVAEPRHNHHVQDIVIPGGMSVPAGWPLKDKKLNCISCHSNPKIASLNRSQLDTDADDFLRGGPYNKPQQFCRNCHEKQADTDNIHNMLDETDRIIEHKCLYCHSSLPEVNKAERHQKVKLRLDKSVICYACHLKTPHLNAVEHQVKVEPEMLEAISNSEKQYQIKLPLADDQVICITCHSPHQRGVLDVNLPEGKQTGGSKAATGSKYVDHSWDKVIQRDKRDRLSALSIALSSSPSYTFKYQQIQNEILLRLPAKNGRLCLACHQFPQ